MSSLTPTPKDGERTGMLKLANARTRAYSSRKLAVFLGPPPSPEGPRQGSAGPFCQWRLFAPQPRSRPSACRPYTATRFRPSACRPSTATRFRPSAATCLRPWTTSWPLCGGASGASGRWSSVTIGALAATGSPTAITGASCSTGRGTSWTARGTSSNRCGDGLPCRTAWTTFHR